MGMDCTGRKVVARRAGAFDQWLCVSHGGQAGEDGRAAP